MKKTFLKIALLLLAPVLVSFHTTPGGEGFEVFLNNKVILQQFGSDMSKVKGLDFSGMKSTDKLTVKYHHCGKSGKNRVITFLNEKDVVLKTFRYPDTTPLTAMEIPLAGLLSIKGSLKMFYSSSELPNGRVLASVSSSNPALAAR